MTRVYAKRHVAAKDGRSSAVSIARIERAIDTVAR